MRKNPVVMIDIPRFCVESMGFSAYDVGVMFADIFRKAITGEDDDAIMEEYVFVRRVRANTAARPSVSPSHRRKVIAVGFCKHCGSTSDLSVDHIIPLARGGEHGMSNYQCLCRACNRRKGKRLESEL